jgi:hypothetical protein
MYGTRCQFAHLLREQFNTYESILSENARQMAIRIQGVVNPDLSHFNVVAPQLKRLPAFRTVCEPEESQSQRKRLRKRE